MWRLVASHSLGIIAPRTLLVLFIRSHTLMHTYDSLIPPFIHSFDRSTALSFVHSHIVYSFPLTQTYPRAFIQPARGSLRPHDIGDSDSKAPSVVSPRTAASAIAGVLSVGAATDAAAPCTPY